jgi:hypothetical protein
VTGNIIHSALPASLTLEAIAADTGTEAIQADSADRDALIAAVAGAARSMCW